MNRYLEAINLFRKLYGEVQTSSLHEPTAVTLATADGRGRPSVRMVLLKSFDERGFVFYTNTQSRKGRDLGENPHAALCFHWPPIEHQVIVEGMVEPVSAEEADAYWVTRPRTSQLGGWASLQSQPSKGQAHLLARVAKFELQFLARSVPRPAHWSGYRIIPDRIEFWKAGAFRLHERTTYTKTGGTWEVTTLFP